MDLLLRFSTTPHCNIVVTEKNKECCILGPVDPKSLKYGLPGPEGIHRTLNRPWYERSPKELPKEFYYRLTQWRNDFWEVTQSPGPRGSCSKTQDVRTFRRYETEDRWREKRNGKRNPPVLGPDKRKDVIGTPVVSQDVLFPWFIYRQSLIYIQRLRPLTHDRWGRGKGEVVSGVSIGT